MNININNGISVEFKTKPKISKSDNTKYQLYIECLLYQHGIRNGYVSVSTGINIQKSEWSKGNIIGRNTLSKLLNERLNNHLVKTKDLLNELSLKQIKTCGGLKKELECNLKLRLTGKPPRGYKNDFISKLKDYTYESVMNRLFEDKEISEGRKRGYNRGFKLLKEYYNDEVPTIDQITSEDLEEFKKWLLPKYSNQNTRTDYQSKIGAVIKHGMKLKIITVNPLPDGFRGSWKDGERETLTESEMLKLIKLPDDELNQTELIGKYCLLVQLLTGVGYSDLKSFRSANIKFNERENHWYIEKERNKTEVKFTVYLSENGVYCLKRLGELTGDVNNPFNLPSIDYTNRIYKVLQTKCDISTKITTYTLRHSYAVHYMDNDGRLEDLQKMLGHTNIKTTQIYGKISDKRLSEKMKYLQSVSKVHQLSTPNKLKVV